jgi:hypothetical protein
VKPPVIGFVIVGIVVSNNNMVNIKDVRRVASTSATADESTDPSCLEVTVVPGVEGGDTTGQLASGRNVDIRNPAGGQIVAGEVESLANHTASLSKQKEQQSAAGED